MTIKKDTISEVKNHKTSEVNIKHKTTTDAEFPREEQKRAIIESEITENTINDLENPLSQKLFKPTQNNQAKTPVAGKNSMNNPGKLLTEQPGTVISEHEAKKLSSFKITNEPKQIIQYPAQTSAKVNTKPKFKITAQKIPIAKIKIDQIEQSRVVAPSIVTENDMSGKLAKQLPPEPVKLFKFAQRFKFRNFAIRVNDVNVNKFLGAVITKPSPGPAKPKLQTLFDFE